MRDFAHSYLFLRRFIGFIGTLLPFAVIIGVAVMSGELLTSVSASYHTGMRDVFVGSMCAIGVFLIFYRGLNWRDDLLGWIAGLAAIGVALVPPARRRTPRPPR
ncbi:hypothetical protein [Actinocrispum sp. NPDC049592]|uniref:hypothetical protein n=1 Tax=Actinocrispum sp. NPDC049592 TaxID=3154835 RepID=UPI003420AD9B